MSSRKIATRSKRSEPCRAYPVDQARSAIGVPGRSMTLLLLILLLGGMDAQSPILELADHPLADRLIWDPRAQRPIDAAELEQRITSARFLLLGEVHDNPRHHTLQARLIELVAAAHRRPLVAMEMIDDSQAAALERCLAECEQIAEELPDAIDWRASGWPRWELYRPIIETAARHRLLIRAANLSRPVLLERAFAAEGQHRADDRDMTQELDPAALASLEQTLLDSHCGQPIAGPQLRGMVRAQRLRDARMLQALIERGIESPDGSVLIAGNGHVRRDWGVARDLESLVGDAAVLSIAFTEVDERTDPALYTDTGDDAPFDVVWFTARARRDDPCEAMRTVPHSHEDGD